jgi:hypothetical protein
MFKMRALVAGLRLETRFMMVGLILETRAQVPGLWQEMIALEVGLMSETRHVAVCVNGSSQRRRPSVGLRLETKHMAVRVSWQRHISVLTQIGRNKAARKSVKFAGEKEVSKW